MDSTISLASVWERVWARRRPVVVVVASATLIVGAIAFLLRPWYRAEAELLPPSEEETGVGIASLLRGMAVPGIRIPTQVTPADVFMVVLDSQRISTQMVERFNLKKLYKEKLETDAIHALKEHTRFKLTQPGTIKISVEDTDPRRAAAMTNAYMEFLDQFNREVRMTKGRRTRIFIESRLVETRRDLEAAETRLAKYQAQNKAAVLTPQMSSAVEQAAALYGRRTALEVRLGVIRSYSQGSEEEIQVQAELSQIDRQLQALPETGMELARLVRDVKAHEQVFAFLTGQYEDAHIQEARDMVTV
jgi:uncharacterized protein involved in exopolysaccharide biosynthesis